MRSYTAHGTRKNDMPKSKLKSLHDAIAEHVPDGSSVVLGTSLESLIPFSAGHELIRQRKKDLTLIGPISDILFDQIIGGGCVKKVRAAWVGNVITGSGYNFRRAVENETIQVEDHSNLTIAMALKGGAMGVPFMPTHTALGSDLFKTNANLTQMICPYTGQSVCLVKSIQPDVAIIHVQRADEFGNAHSWGNLGISRDACMASESVILTAEEIVSPSSISSDPNRVITPGFHVSAVVHRPFGAHPSAVPGFYNRDHQVYIDYRNASKTKTDYLAWRKRWVDPVSCRQDYIDLVGNDHLRRLSLQHHVMSEVVDYGY
jgi:glutaconate CoA-transferase subunit A